MNSTRVCPDCGFRGRGLLGHAPTCKVRADRPNTLDFIKLGQKLRHERIIPTCLTCLHFDERLEMCKLFQMRPPAHVIVDGCVYWHDDMIPF